MELNMSLSWTFPKSPFDDKSLVATATQENQCMTNQSLVPLLPSKEEVSGSVGRVSFGADTLHTYQAMTDVPRDIAGYSEPAGVKQQPRTDGNALECVHPGAPARNKEAPVAAEGLLDLGHFRGSALEFLDRFTDEGVLEATILGSDANADDYTKSLSQVVSPEGSTPRTPRAPHQFPLGQETTGSDRNPNTDVTPTIHEKNGVEAAVGSARAPRGKVLKGMGEFPRPALVSPKEGPSAPKATTKTSHKQTSSSSRPVGSGKSTGTRSSKTGRRPSGQQLHPFAVSVHAMVTETASKNPSLISWVADGEAFVINDKDRNLGAVLRRYFKHNKYTSLQRQLNMYGWKKHTKGRYQGAFYHPDFHRDRGSSADLAKIQRNATTDAQVLTPTTAKRSSPRMRKPPCKVYEDELTKVVLSKTKPSRPKRKKVSAQSRGTPSVVSRAKISTTLEPAQTSSEATITAENGGVQGDFTSTTPTFSNQSTICNKDAGLSKWMPCSTATYTPSQPPKKRRVAFVGTEGLTSSPRDLLPHPGAIQQNWAVQEVGLSPSACWSPLIEDIKLSETDLLEEKNGRPRCAPSFVPQRLGPSKSVITVSERPVGDGQMSLFHGAVTLTSSPDGPDNVQAFRSTEGHETQTSANAEASEDLTAPLSLGRAKTSPVGTFAPEPFLRSSSSSYFLPFMDMSTALGPGNQTHAGVESASRNIPVGQPDEKAPLSLDPRKAFIYDNKTG